MKSYYFLFLLLFPLFIMGQGNPVTQVYSSGNYYKAIALADYNDDGVVDVWSANSTNNHVEIWTYSANRDSLIMVDEISGLPDPDAYIHDLAAADLDGDGDMDAVVTLRRNGTYLCINNGSGSWSVSQLDGTYGWQVIIADFNMDENPDILIATDWSYLKIYYGDGSGSFEAGSAPASAFTYGDSKGMNAVDVDNDGDPDIIGIAGEWTNSGTNRYFMRAYKNVFANRDSSWGSFYVEDDSLTMLPGQVQSSDNSAGDINGDGLIDLVAFTSTNDIIVFYGAQDSQGYYLQKADTLLKSYSSPFSSVILLDMGSDSNLDIIAGGYSNFDGVILFKNDGSGNLDSEYVQLGHGVGEFHSLKAGDIDGNGVTDIIGARYDFDLQADDGFQIYFFPENEETADSIIYVNHDAHGNNDGTSWENAYFYLEDALANAKAGSQIWVAGGTYHPGYNDDGKKNATGQDPRAYSFVIPDSVSLYGGFNGTEESLDERGADNGEETVSTTILNGDIQEIGNMEDNCYHVVKTSNYNLIDGFVITGGNAISTSPDNMGAAIYNTGDNITISNCVFVGNYALEGGCIANYRVGMTTDNIEIRNCFFYKNKSENGGGIGNWDCPTTIERCMFVADSVSNMGGAIYNWGALSDADIIHCTFYGNAAGDSALGGAVHSRAGGIETNVINSIFWNNSSDIGYGSETHGAVTHVYYSDLQQTENIEGSNNLSENPMFVDDTLYFDLSLRRGSPCIDAGTDLLVIGSDTLFQSDSSGYNGAAPDMGVVESDYVSAIEEVANLLPQDFELMQNYPNPFNPVTTIRYKLAENAHVNLAVYDIQGREVTTLVDAQQNAGSYSMQFKASNLASGVYIYKITAGNYTNIKKMILVR